MQEFLRKTLGKDIVAITKNLSALFFSEAISFFQLILSRSKGWLRRTIFNRELSVPIIIYQPGKVGSTSVQQSLDAAFKLLDMHTPVYHAHNLNRIELIEESIKQHRKDPSKTLKKLATSKALRKEIDRKPSKEWKIISLVRDPVALRVSTMFQLLDEYIPDWAELVKANQLSVQDLQELLLSREEFAPQKLTAWFDNQVKDLFGFDVFSVPFDTEKGFTIYRLPNNRFSLMIIRLEDLDRVAPKAFQQFIGLNKFEMIKANVGDEKPYRELYRQFKSLPLPAGYVDSAYDTPYARQFYTPNELEAFRQRWLNPTITEGG